MRLGSVLTRGISWGSLIVLCFHPGCSKTSRQEKKALRHQVTTKAHGENEPLRFSYVGNFEEGLARVELSGRWGFIDAERTIRIPTRYQWAESFSEGLAGVKKNGTWGYIDRSGKTIIDFQYMDVAMFSDGLAAVRQKNGWSYIDAKGQVVIFGPFEAARPFGCTVARVKYERHCLVTSCADLARNFACCNGGAYCQELDKVSTESEYCSVAEDVIRGESKGGRWAAEKWHEHRWLFIDRKGAVVDQARAKAACATVRSDARPATP